MFLTTVPFAKDGDMTTWIPEDKDLAPIKRPILCSCETFQKRSLNSESEGSVSNNIVHGIASIFCSAPYRCHGYAGRMVQELVKELDSQIELAPKPGVWSALAKAIAEDDLQDICKRDEALVRSQIAVPTDEIKTRFTIIPDLDHMGWHVGKEQFATDYLFKKTPTAKGVLAGPPGSQVWATRAHRYYGRVDAEEPSNVMYILREVIEFDETPTRLPLNAAKRPSKGV
ncbi:hypothetical protein HBI26_126890 [Parastagonospora nodorum]|nr:hypothetical protein HBH43_094520 [Parastagonospora nodorum]KAH5254380.1 hypothetical protein HBI72_134150 [Parastagonospora nodorum]KAH5580566.1 hypothetical protein HBI26_126890 [Parastagonospora nodorum]KAH6204617.1 hypothetical protein HBI53_136320 [Parastagonospora nodorum]KAH6294507.1 hypothetical protein HBI39_166500 [Parastagonospora nodorum]